MSDLKTYQDALKKASATIEYLVGEVDRLKHKEPVAIIGMGCRLPGGANSPEAYWSLLSEGRDAISTIPAERWDADRYFDENVEAPGKMYVREGGFLDCSPYDFDPRFFGVSPKEAKSLDPQQRLLLEVAWEALEAAGINPVSLQGSRTGVFIGISSSDYESAHLRSDDLSLIDAFSMTGISFSLAAGRISYTLGLEGPSLPVDTACSSSLVALHLACRSLKTGECDLALVGGVNLMLTPEPLIALCKLQGLSPEGRCKTFDASANGYGRGEGCGMIVLKRLETAQRDGDRILALVKGSAINNDGRSNGLTTPNGVAQRRVISSALDDASLHAGDIDYVEAHGTGTPLGDSIEAEAIAAALGKGHDAAHPLLIGSAKTNIGHLEAAAGVAGIIKLVLALDRENIPPHLHFSNPNPHIAWDQLPLKVVSSSVPWPRSDRPRRAGISGFGFNGTNAHVILEEAPLPGNLQFTDARTCHLLVLSAADKTALRALAGLYAEYLGRPALPSLAAICNTAATGRNRFSFGLAAVGTTPLEMAQRLSAYAEQGTTAGLYLRSSLAMDKVSPVFLFTGHGEQYPGMGKELYQSSPVYCEALDRCDSLFTPLLGISIRDLMHGDSEEEMARTIYTQSAIFSLEYSLARLWQSWGVVPSAVMGHGIGELVAVCIAGMLSLEDAVTMVAHRGRLMNALPVSGVMAAVLCPEAMALQVIAPYIGLVSVAAVDSPGTVVISGEQAEVAAALEAFKQQGISSQYLTVSHAFNSHLMDPVLDEFELVASGLTFHEPLLPVISNVTGRPAVGGDLRTAAHWRQHLCGAVRFSDSVEYLKQQGYNLFLEIGATAVLSSSIRQPAGAACRYVASLKRGVPPWSTLAEALGELFAAGVDIDWKGYDTPYCAGRVSIPTYPFQRERYIMDPVREPVVMGAANGLSLDQHDEAVLQITGLNMRSISKEQWIKESDTSVSTPSDSPSDAIECLVRDVVNQVLGTATLVDNSNFFQLGGNSLLATQTVSRLNDLLKINLPIRIIFEHPTISGLSHAIKSDWIGNTSLISSPQLIERYGLQDAPLSYSQRRMWFLYQLSPDSWAYNIPVALHLYGRLDLSALTKSFELLVSRHESLRTIFVFNGVEPIQRVLPSRTIGIEEADLTPLLPTDRIAVVHRLLTEATQQPFDLAKGPLVRLKLLRLAEDESVLLIVKHHIIGDQWSFTVLLRELATFYGHFAVNDLSNLPVELSFQYADFAMWQHDWLTNEKLEKLLAYWQERLRGIQPLTLPLDYARPALQSFHGGTVTIELPPALRDKLMDFSWQQGSTLFMTAFACFSVLLYRYSGQEDIAVGVPIANRNHLASEGLIGTFVNTVVMRTDLSGDPTFTELLAKVREVALGAYANQDMPFEMLVDRLNVVRDTSISPLFQVMFNMINAPLGDIRLSGLEWTRVIFDRGAAQFDLTVTIDPVLSNTVDIEYCTELFNHSTVERIAQHYLRLLEAVVLEPDSRISTLSLLDDHEKRLIIHEWNRTQAEYPRNACIHDLVEQQAARSPLATAVSATEGTLSYAELDARACQMGDYLRQKGVERGDLVGICLDRTPDMVVALLGVLKSGAAYVPLDPAFPSERLGFMADDAQLKLILTANGLIGAVPPSDIPRVCIDNIVLPAVSLDSENYSAATSEDLAYILYTSGSTGKPKGVEVSHGALTNFLWSMRERPGCSATDILLSVTTLSFDIAALELYLPLIVGGRVELASSHVAADSRLLMERIEQCRPTILQATPATWRMLIQAGWTGTSGMVALCGGEGLPRDLANQLLERTEALWNMYGPTETTIWSTLAKIEAGQGEIGIGKPIANTQVYVLDQAMQPVPIGVAGELYIGGDGVARGYRNRPDLTAERFVPDPFSMKAGARLYRTGDLVRSLTDGSLIHLGRLDFQVKIRGFRIELGEIQTVLTRHPAVEQVVVKAVDDNQGVKQLAAYIISRSNNPTDLQDLRSYLRQSLPDYMVPSFFIFMEKFPLTANNKVDTQAFPAPSTDSAAHGKAWAGPRNRLETQLIALWRQTLEVDELGIHDNFFDVGGHSLKAVQLLSQVEKVVGKRLPLATLFQSPTVAQMAESLSSIDWKPLHRSLVTIQASGDKVPFFAVPGAGGHALMFAKLARLLGADQPFYGLQPPGIDNFERPFDSINETAAHYISEIRSIQPIGPYFIGGGCTGGVIAFEMAQQLMAQGEKVILAVMDSWHPSSSSSYLKIDLSLLLLKQFCSRGVNFLKNNSPRKWIGLLYAKLVGTNGMISYEQSELYRLSLYRKNMQAVARYQIREFPGSLLNVVASARQITSDAEDTRRCWDTLALGESRTEFIAAEDSGQLFVSPHVEILAQLLIELSEELH